MLVIKQIDVDVQQPLSISLLNTKQLLTGPVEIDTSGSSPIALNNDAQDLSHSINQSTLPNGENDLLSTVTTTISEALPAHLSSRAPTNMSCLEGSDSILMENQNCLPSSSQLEDSANQSNLMDHNNLTSNQAASFLSSYAQEHQGGSIGIGKNINSICLFSDNSSNDIT